MEPKVPHSLVQAIRALPDFSQLDEETLLKIVGESVNLAWRSGSAIFRRGDAGEALYVMLEGECSIHEGETPADGEIVRRKPGDSFGEMSLLLNATHSRNATAITDCELLVLPKKAFERLLGSSPSLADHFDRVLKARSNGA